MAVVAELMEAEELLRLHPEFQAALARRGVTDPEQIQVDAWPAGHFGRAEESERRLARGVAFVKPKPGDNEWAHPVDGVIALVDLNTLEVLRVEDHGVVPVPPESGNFDAAAGAARSRDDITPLEITQPEGPSFTVDGRVRPLAALAAPRRLHAARGARAATASATRTAAALRPILHRASLSRDGRPLRRPQPDALLEERVRRGRVRRRRRRLAADARLRLPRRDPLLRRRRRNDAAGEPVRDPERDLHARGGLRHPLEAHRRGATARARCAARAGS